MEEIIGIILKWGIPFILTAMLGFVTKVYKDNKAIKDSMVLLLRSQIVGKCEQWLEAGYLPQSVRSCLDDMFKQYDRLGGNHGVGTLVEQCFALPPYKKKEGK